MAVKIMGIRADRCGRVGRLAFNDYYEVMSTVGKRMPRVYVDGGRIITLQDILDSGL